MQGGRLKWFGQIDRRDSDYVDKRMLTLELPGRRPEGRPKRRFLDVAMEDMRGMSVGDSKKRVRWRQMICRSNLPRRLR